MKWFLFFLATSFFASDCCSSCKPYEGVEGKLFSAPPYMGQPSDPCGIFYIADVSLLAWQALVGGLEFALKNDPLPIQSNTNVNGHLIRPDFSWEPAVKIDVRAVFANRAWDAAFRWTYFHSHPSRTVHASLSPNTSGLYPLWAFPNDDMGAQFLYGSAKGSYELNFNGVDIEMGYHPLLSPAFSFRFITGLKVVQIEQEFHVHYSEGFNNGSEQLVSAHADLSNASIGTGPRLGFASEWQLGSGFSLLGSFTGALPLWHIRVNRNDTDQNIRASAPQTINSLFRNRFWIFCAVLETALGCGWDTYFGCNNQYPFGIHASYEFQYYSEQNMMTMLVNPGILNRSFMPRGDLALHGATFTFRFGF